MSASSPRRLDSNSGGGPLEHYRVTAAHDGHHLLHMRCPDSVIKQVRMADHRYGPATALDRLGERTMRGAGRKPTPRVGEVLGVLTEVLSLPELESLDFVLALDWTSKPTDGVERAKWPPTEIYELVHKGKYVYIQPDQIDDRRRVGTILANQVSAVVRRHPLLREMDAIASVPGHDPKRVSFGESLADAISRNQRVPFIKGRGSGFRTPVKNVEIQARKVGLGGKFRCDMEIDAWSVLIIDDVYQSGSTVSEMARALRAAGAASVAGLCAARTLRFRN